MENIKNEVIRQLKQSGQTNSSEAITDINNVNTRDEIAMILLSRGYVEVFVMCFEPEEIKDFWKKWLIKDYLETQDLMKQTPSTEFNKVFELKESNQEKLYSRIQKALVRKMNNYSASSYETRRLKRLQEDFGFN